MKRVSSAVCIALYLMAASCGSDAENSNAEPANAATNNVATNNTSANATTNNAGNNSTANSTTVDETVQIECVSDLVTAGGNYYAVTAEITAGQARVEIINFLAATPTSDPVEQAIWNEQVAAQFSPVAFVFQTEEYFLDVTKAADEAMYTGTMSGESQFSDTVSATCWPVDLEHPASYSAESGNCVDEAGEPAANQIPWMVALRTGFGQCTAFDGSLAGEATGATFDFIDLRGADFSNAMLRNAVVQEVQLEGADLSELTIDSASISGTKDGFTLLPLGGCQDDGDTFTCSN